MNTLEINSQPFVLNTNMENGLLKGSVWENLYIPYKYIPTKVGKMTEFEQALYVLQVYTFMSIELTLYISTHPDCTEAKDTLRRVNSERDKVKSYVEGKFGGLCSKSVNYSGYFDLKETWCDNRVGI